jgi:hypothetical protein
MANDDAVNGGGGDENDAGNDEYNTDDLYYGTDDEQRWCMIYDKTDFFTIFVQMLLACFALGSLYFKRLREVPRRTFSTWFMDVFKQGLGACYAHIMNMVRILYNLSLQYAHHIRSTFFITFSKCHIALFLIHACFFYYCVRTYGHAKKNMQTTNKYRSLLRYWRETCPADPRPPSKEKPPRRRNSKINAPGTA